MPSYITCDLLIHLVQQKKRYQVPGFLFGEDVRTHADCDGRNGKNIFGTALHCVSSKVWYSSQSLNVGLYCSFFRNQKFDDILKDIRFFEVRAAGVGGEGIGQLGLEKLKSQVVFVCFFVFAFFIVFMYYLGLCVSFVFVFYFCFTFFCVCVFWLSLCFPFPFIFALSFSLYWGFLCQVMFVCFIVFGPFVLPRRPMTIPFIHPIPSQSHPTRSLLSSKQALDWSASTSNDLQWLPMTSNDYQWLPMTTDDYQWLSDD